MPSPAPPSLCAPSSNIVELAKLGGDPLLALRDHKRTVRPGFSSSTRALIVTSFVERGTGGKCPRSEINGGPLFVATEFSRPGVPWEVRLEVQFLGTLLSKAAFSNSSDFPKPSCSANQSQPFGK